MAWAVADQAPEGGEAEAEAEGTRGSQAEAGRETMRPRFGHLANPWTASQLVSMWQTPWRNTLREESLSRS